MRTIRELEIKPILSTCVCAVLIIFQGALLADEGPDPTLVDHLRSWKKSADAIRSYDVYVDISRRVIDNGELVDLGNCRVRQRCVGHRWRIDILRRHNKYNDGTEDRWESKGDIKAYAYNFDKRGVRFYSSEDNFGEVKPPGPDQQTRVKLIAPHWFETFQRDYYGESFLSMLEYRAPGGTTTTVDSTIILKLPRAQADHHHNLAHNDFIVHLAADRGFQPTMIRRGATLDRNPDFIAEIHNELGEVSDGIWAPVRSTQRIFATKVAGTIETPASEMELALDLAESKFNVDIPPEVFEMPFPPGTVVYDAAQKTNYIEGGRDKAR